MKFLSNFILFFIFTFVAFSGQTFSMELMQDEEIDINAQDENGSTSLLRSTGIAELNVIKLLIRSKADVKVKDKQGNTALHYLFREPLNKNHFEIVKILVQNKIDVNAQNEKRETALLKLFSNCLQDGVKKAINQNQNPHEFKDAVKTSVNNCLNEGLKITQLLLESKADPNLSSGSSCLHYVMHYYLYDSSIPDQSTIPESSISFQENTKKFIELLLLHKADVFACNKFWITPYSMLSHNENWVKIMQKFVIFSGSNLPKPLVEIIFDYTGIMPQYGS